ncbi:MAG TPA: ABC transporter permease subunit [Burkholderiaceae bacterium]|nr:ABC transporter permease subunit [Burkholderiaceae bacterium]HQR71148.1 ABC transporter permease subunit [Burkholderiaceae bacterium]
MKAALVVFAKELKDALRDRRTWLVVLVSSLVAGPVSLLLIASIVSSAEESAARREIVIVNAAMAPTLVNFLRRNGATVRDAPADYREQLVSGRLQNAVVVVPDDFDRKLTSGEPVRLEVVFDETAQRAQTAVRTTIALLQGYNREAGTQRLLARGVSPQVLQPLQIEEVNLAASRARGAQLLFLVPWLALVGAVVGAISVAIDVTAGERERGSLEPLLMNPVSTAAIVIGKWAVAATCSAAVVVLTLAGFTASMQFVRSENLAAMMQFGLPEVLLFLVLLLPFSAMVASVNMLAATYGRSHKEAQTYASYITMVVNFVPIIPLFLTIRDAPWQLAVPALGQQTVLMRALRGETVSAADILVPSVIALAVTAAALLLQARLLRNERIVFSR